MVLVLGVVAVALVGLLLLVAFDTFMRPMVEVMRSVPFGVGDWLANHSAEAMNRARAQILVWGAQAVQPLVAVISLPATVLERNFNLSIRAFEGVFNALWRMRWQTIPFFHSQAVQHADAVGERAVGYTRAVYAQLVLMLTDFYARLQIYAVALHQQALQYVEQLHAQALQFAQALHAQELQYTQAVRDQLLRYAQALQAQALNYARTLQAQALGFAEDAFGRAIEYERQLYGEGIRFSERVGQRATDYARALSERDLAYTAAAVGVVAAAVTAIERSKCQRFCEPLGDLGEDLGDLGDLFEAGALFALAAAAAQDPRGWAQEVAGDLVEPLREATGAVLAEAGIGSRAA